MIIYEELSQSILDSSFEVHRHVGQGALESGYQACLAREFDLWGLKYRQQVDVPLIYKGIHLDKMYRLDFIVEEKIVVGIKAVERIIPVHEAQLLTYLKITGFRVGLLINFNTPLLKQGIIRRVL